MKKAYGILARDKARDLYENLKKSKGSTKRQPPKKRAPVQFTSKKSKKYNKKYAENLYEGLGFSKY